MRLRHTIILVLLFTTNIFAQDHNKYQKDFLELSQILHSSYPLSDAMKNKLSQVEPKYLAELEACSDILEFRLVAAKYMAKLNDGHSKIDCYKSFSGKGGYPIIFKFINEGLYLSNYPNSIPDTYIGKEVVAINGVDIKSLSDKAKDYICADNDVQLRNELKWLLNRFYFYEEIGVDAKSELRLKLQDGSELSWFKDSKEFYMEDKTKKYHIDTSEIEYYEYIKNDITGSTGNLFEYTILKESNTCYFNFMECYDNQFIDENNDFLSPLPSWLVKMIWYFRGGNFSTYISKMFREIENEGIDNLVIDLRTNSGGTCILGYQLMDYLMDMDNFKDYSQSIMISDLLMQTHGDYGNKLLKDKGFTLASLPISIKTDADDIDALIRDKNSHYYQEKPKTKFKGHVYVMVGNYTFSSASMIAVLLADNNLATIVGNPMAIGAKHNGEILDFTLSNTGLQASLSCKAFNRPANEKSKELAIDIKLTNTVLDYYKGIDREFEGLLQRINK